jgi:hypothetical protein
MIGLFLAPFGATEKDAEKPHDAHKKRTAPKSCPLIDLLLALAELRSAACGFETVLSRLVARNPCIYLVFELRHPQFPHSLTTDEILFLPFISPRLRIL